MTERPNVLVVCGRNKKRSRTAEYIFKNDSRFSIRSVGISPSSERKITAKDLSWADVVFVMEIEHKARIKGVYKNIVLPTIEVLNIKDEYEFMDEELIQLLADRMNYTLKAHFDF